MDNFYEQLVTSEKSIIYSLVNILTYIFGALAILSFRYIIVAVILAVLAGVCFYFKRFLFVEYEYDFTNGEIDVDAIYEKQRRKRLLTFDARDIELLAEENSNYVKDFSNKPQKEMNLYPKGSSAGIYTAMITGGAERLQLKFAPNERFLDLVFKYNPRAVKK